MIKLKQIIIENGCFSCDGCCRYHVKDSAWSPVFMQEEIVELVEKDILPAALFSGVRAGTAARPHLVETNGLFYCPCFDADKNRCKIYSYRPFDCQLYPFVLSKKGNTAYLAIAENCPRVADFEKSASFQGYVEYLKTVLSSDAFLRLAVSDPYIVGDYGQDVHYLIPLQGLTSIIHAASSNKYK